MMVAFVRYNGCARDIEKMELVGRQAHARLLLIKCLEIVSTVSK